MEVRPGKAPQPALLCQCLRQACDAAVTILPVSHLHCPGASAARRAHGQAAAGGRGPPARLRSRGACSSGRGHSGGPSGVAPAARAAGARPRLPERDPLLVLLPLPRRHPCCWEAGSKSDCRQGFNRGGAKAGQTLAANDLLGSASCVRKEMQKDDTAAHATQCHPGFSAAHAMHHWQFRLAPCIECVWTTPKRAYHSVHSGRIRCEETEHTTAALVELRSCAGRKRHRSLRSLPAAAAQLDPAANYLQLDAARPQVRRILLSPALNQEPSQAGDVGCRGGGPDAGSDCCQVLQQPIGLKIPWHTPPGSVSSGGCSLHTKGRG